MLLVITAIDQYVSANFPHFPKDALLSSASIKSTTYLCLCPRPPTTSTTTECLLTGMIVCAKFNSRNILLSANLSWPFLLFISLKVIGYVCYEKYCINYFSDNKTKVERN